MFKVLFNSVELLIARKVNEIENVEHPNMTGKCLALNKVVLVDTDLDQWVNVKPGRECSERSTI